MIRARRNGTSARLFLLGVCLSCFIASGCGSRTIYPVHGRVVDTEGNPIPELKGGSVEFEAVDARMSANSSIDENGRFSLTTLKPGDGAHVGRNRVAITRPYQGPDKPSPHYIDPKYENMETSGLEVTVEPKVNEVELKVNRVQRRAR